MESDTTARSKSFPMPKPSRRRRPSGVTAAAERAIAERGNFSIALSGGSTPKALYALLTADLPLADRLAQSPHPLRRRARRAAETRTPTTRWPTKHCSPRRRSRSQIYRMKGELGEKAEQAAKEYGQMLKAEFPTASTSSCSAWAATGHGFDLPGTSAVREKEHRVVGYFAENPAPESWRITMTAPHRPGPRNHGAHGRRRIRQRATRKCWKVRRTSKVCDSSSSSPPATDSQKARSPGSTSTAAAGMLEQ